MTETNKKIPSAENATECISSMIIENNKEILSIENITKIIEDFHSTNTILNGELNTKLELNKAFFSINISFQSPDPINLDYFNERIIKSAIEKIKLLLAYQDYAIASSIGYAVMVKLLLEAGADIRDNVYVGMAKLLLEEGGDVRDDVRTNRDNALIIASAIGYADIVQLLLDTGADVHIRNDYPLRLATHEGHTAVVKLLLENGADIHACTYQVYRLASYRNHIAVTRLLLKADPKVKNSDKPSEGWFNAHAKDLELMITQIEKSICAVKLLAEKEAKNNGNCNNAYIVDCELTTTQIEESIRTVRLLIKAEAKNNDNYEEVD